MNGKHCYECGQTTKLKDFEFRVDGETPILRSFCDRHEPNTFWAYHETRYTGYVSQGGRKYMVTGSYKEVRA